jgi:hypothetical protein
MVLQSPIRFCLPRSAWPRHSLLAPRQPLHRSLIFSMDAGSDLWLIWVSQVLGWFSPRQFLSCWKGVTFWQEHVQVVEGLWCTAFPSYKRSYSKHRSCDRLDMLESRCLNNSRLSRIGYSLCSLTIPTAQQPVLWSRFQNESSPSKSQYTRVDC